MKKPVIRITDNRKEYYRKRRALFLAQVVRVSVKYEIDIQISLQ